METEPGIQPGVVTVNRVTFPSWETWTKINKKGRVRVWLTILEVDITSVR